MTPQEEYWIETASRFCGGYYSLLGTQNFLVKATPEQLTYITENLSQPQAIKKLLILAQRYISIIFTNGNERRRRRIKKIPYSIKYRNFSRGVWDKRKPLPGRRKLERTKIIFNSYPIRNLWPVEECISKADQKTVQAGSRAKEILSQLKKPEAHMVLVERFISDNDVLAGVISQEIQYIPTELTKQALYFALSHQWAKLEAVDSDYNLLLDIFINSTQAAKKQLETACRIGGRTDIISRLLLLEQRKNNSSNNKPVFGFREKIEQLKILQQWDELWRLVFETSPDWSRVILTELAKTDWMPNKSGEKDLYIQLCKLENDSVTSNFINHIIEPVGQKKIESNEFSERGRHPEISPNGKYLIDFGEYDRFNIFSIEDYSLITSLVDVHLILSEEEIKSIAAKNGIASIGADQASQYFRLGYYQNSFSQNGQVAGIIGSWFFFDATGSFLATFNFKDEKNFTKTYINIKQDYCNSLVLSPNGRYAILYTQPDWKPEQYFEIGIIEIYDLVQKTLINIIDSPPLAFGADDATVILNKEDKGIKFLSFPELVLLKEFPTWQSVRYFYFYPVNNFMLVAYPNPQAWNLENNAYLSDFQINPVNNKIYPYNTEISFSVNGENTAKLSDNGEFLVVHTTYRNYRNRNHKNKSLYFSKKGFTDKRITRSVLLVITKSGQALPIYKSFKDIQIFFFTNSSKSICFQENYTTLKTYSILAYYLYNLPVQKCEYQDFLKLQKMIENPKLTAKKRNWLKFIEACHALKWRYEIQVENAPTLAPDKFDIELETENQN